MNSGWSRGRQLRSARVRIRAPNWLDPGHEKSTREPRQDRSRRESPTRRSGTSCRFRRRLAVAEPLAHELDRQPARLEPLIFRPFREVKHVTCRELPTHKPYPNHLGLLVVPWEGNHNSRSSRHSRTRQRRSVPQISLTPREWITRSFSAPIHLRWRRCSGGSHTGSMRTRCHRGGSTPIIDRVIHSRCLTAIVSTGYAADPS
jgi:hypothetical protein